MESPQMFIKLFNFLEKIITDIQQNFFMKHERKKERNVVMEKQKCNLFSFFFGSSRVKMLGNHSDYHGFTLQFATRKLAHTW